MLKIYLGDMDGVLHNVETYFKNQLDYSWLNDDFVKEVIQDVDKSTVESVQCINSPVLGQIPPTSLSGGTKALILMKFLDDRVINASNCGDNCAKWILKLGEEQDLTINLNHIMDFGTQEFCAEILNDNSMILGMKEFVMKAIEYL
jgi:hypothetical protein